MGKGSITEIHLSEANQWDQIVRAFPDYDVFYLNGYSKAFYNENKANGEPLLLLYQKGTERAISIVFVRDISLDPHLFGKLESRKYYDLSTPYGYGGFVGEVSDWETLEDTYIDFCKEKKFVSEFVRFQLFSDYHRHYKGNTVIKSHNVVRALNLSMDEMWMDFKQKVRKNVKRAEKNNLNLVIDENGKHMKDFLRIYYSTMERSNAEKAFFFSESFFHTLMAMDANASFFHVKSGLQIVSSELVIYGAKNAYSFLGGTDEGFFGLRPNDYLKFGIINWCREKGLGNFVLGGGYGCDDGIFEYKRAFAPNGIVNFHIGKRMFDKYVYEELVKLRGMGTEAPDYFPAYRADKNGNL